MSRLVLALGLVVNHAILNHLAAALLLGWAVWHGVRGHRLRLRVGMRTGLAGLALWSFLMSSVHGAGLMLVPVVLPLCASRSAPHWLSGAMTAIGLHTAVMLAMIAGISVIVYDWVGLAVLRSGWINFDLIWIAALGICGVLQLLA